MKTLILTDEEFATLEQIFDLEWQQEYQFQIDGDHDTHWLERYLELYKKIICSKHNQSIERLVASDLIDTKENDIKEIQDDKSN